MGDGGRGWRASGALDCARPATSTLLDLRQPGRRAQIIDPTRWPLALFSRSRVQLGTMPMRWLGIFALLLLLLVPRRAFASEADFHHGLTKWLAGITGFTDDAAEAIASGNLLADQHLYDATHLIPWDGLFPPAHQNSITSGL